MFLLFYIDHTSLFSPHGKEVYDNLISVVGSEMDIRIRQNVFLIFDKVFNRVNTDKTQVCRAERFICCAFCNMLTKLNTYIVSMSLPERSKPSAKLPLDTWVLSVFTLLNTLSNIRNTFCLILMSISLPTTLIRLS
jgi:sulfur relay (sulfurtransferase) DsrF/TusC family protein